MRWRHRSPQDADSKTQIPIIIFFRPWPGLWFALSFFKSRAVILNRPKDWLWHSGRDLSRAWPLCLNARISTQSSGDSMEQWIDYGFNDSQTLAKRSNGSNDINSWRVTILVPMAWEWTLERQLWESMEWQGFSMVAIANHEPNNQLVTNHCSGLVDL